MITWRLKDDVRNHRVVDLMTVFVVTQFAIFISFLRRESVMCSVNNIKCMKSVCETYEYKPFTCKRVCVNETPPVNVKVKEIYITMCGIYLCKPLSDECGIIPYLKVIRRRRHSSKLTIERFWDRMNVFSTIKIKDTWLC